VDLTFRVTTKPTVGFRRGVRHEMRLSLNPSLASRTPDASTAFATEQESRDARSSKRRGSRDALIRCLFLGLGLNFLCYDHVSGMQSAAVADHDSVSFVKARLGLGIFRGLQPYLYQSLLDRAVCVDDQG